MKSTSGRLSLIQTPDAMSSLVLRKACPDDSEFAYRAKKAAFKAYVEKAWGWHEDEQLRLHEQRFRTQDFRVISLASRDVGVVAVAVTADCIRVNQLFILPEYQGKGIGRACMLLIMDEARDLGVSVCLRVMKVSHRAQAFYERLGFTRTGETDHHELMEWSP